MSASPSLALAGLLPSWLRIPRERLPILMYHKIKPVAGDCWTVTTTELERQLAHLRTAGYQAIGCQELADHLDGQVSLPPRPVLITFDDGYLGQLELACPLLARYGLRATLFLPARFIGSVNAWDGGGERLAAWEQLRSLPTNVVEFGLHSHSHENYRRLSLAAIAADLGQAIAEFERHGVPWSGGLAYPYGRDPGRRSLRRRAVHRLLSALGVRCALRIGNRVNRLPGADRYSLARIDIRGDDTLESFCRKLAA